MFTTWEHKWLEDAKDTTDVTAVTAGHYQGETPTFVDVRPVDMFGRRMNNVMAGWVSDNNVEGWDIGPDYIMELVWSNKAMRLRIFDFYADQYEECIEDHGEGGDDCLPYQVEVRSFDTPSIVKLLQTHLRKFPRGERPYLRDPKVLAQWFRWILSYTEPEDYEYERVPPWWVPLDRWPKHQIAFARRWRQNLKRTDLK